MQFHHYLKNNNNNNNNSNEVGLSYPRPVAHPFLMGLVGELPECPQELQVFQVGEGYRMVSQENTAQS